MKAVKAKKPGKKQADIYVSLPTMAAYCKLSMRQIDNLVASKVVIKLRPGVYAALKSLINYVELLKRKKPDETRKRIDEHKESLEALKVEQKGIELDTQKGDLVNKSDVENEAFITWRTARDKLYSGHSRIAPMLVAETDMMAIKKILRTETDMVLNDIYATLTHGNVQKKRGRRIKAES